MKNDTTISDWLSMIIQQKLICTCLDSFPAHSTKVVLHLHVKSPFSGVVLSIIIHYN